MGGVRACKQKNPLLENNKNNDDDDDVIEIDQLEPSVSNRGISSLHEDLCDLLAMSDITNATKKYFQRKSLTKKLHKSKSEQFYTIPKYL